MSAADRTPGTDTPTPLARRLGPVVAIGGVVLALATIGWMAQPPAALAGPLVDAPVTVPATLAHGPDADGCIQLHAGDGTVSEVCVEELAGEGYRGDIAFTVGGDLEIFDGEGWTVVDADTGEVLDRTGVESGDGRTSPAGGPPPVEPRYASVDGDVVRDDRGSEVLLDLDGPPGYDLRDAVVSPDGRWVVATDERDRVLVGEAGGDAVYEWFTADDDRWVNLYGAVRWEDG